MIIPKESRFERIYTQKKTKNGEKGEINGLDVILDFFRYSVY